MVTKVKTKTKTDKPVKAAKEVKEKYWEALGRRKTAVARVRISEGKGFFVNGKSLKEYFRLDELVNSIESPLHELKISRFKVDILPNGGGLAGQAEAARLGLARVLVKYDPELQKTLRQLGFLTRDPRMKERKKPGLKRARKAPQWSKR